MQCIQWAINHGDGGPHILIKTKYLQSTKFCMFAQDNTVKFMMLVKTFSLTVALSTCMTLASQN